jgi:hypothetical protein
VYYQLPNGKTVYLTIEEFLSLTDQDIQYLVSLDYGESILNPFSGSAVDKCQQDKHYDFDYLNMEEYEEPGNISTSSYTEDTSYDEIIDIPDNPLD